MLDSLLNSSKGYGKGYDFAVLFNYMCKLSKTKKNYSEPKIYTGGVDVSKWSKLSNEEKKKTLNKVWYVYFSFRNFETKKLERQKLLKVSKKLNVNDRLRNLKVIQFALLQLLENGFNPNVDTIDSFSNKNKGSATLNETIKLFLKEKEKVVSERTAKDLERRLFHFEVFLKNKYFSIDLMISAINKNMVIEYLNTTLERTSPKTRNNTRVDLNTFFNWLSSNDYITKNFVSSIPILKSKPKKHKLYSKAENVNIFEYLSKKDPVLGLFVKFVSYGFMRPIEVCRLTVGDINIAEKTLSYQAKNKDLKTKRIPNILLDEIPKEWFNYPKEYNLFGIENIPMVWDTKENNKRDFYSKRFKKVKDELKLDENQTM